MPQTTPLQSKQQYSNSYYPQTSSTLGSTAPLPPRDAPSSVPNATAVEPSSSFQVHSKTKKKKKPAAIQASITSTDSVTSEIPTSIPADPVPVTPIPEPTVISPVTERADPPPTDHRRPFQRSLVHWSPEHSHSL